MGGFDVLLDAFARLGHTVGVETASLAARLALAALLAVAGVY
jgi:hypothetical protein